MDESATFGAWPQMLAISFDVVYETTERLGVVSDELPGRLVVQGDGFVNRDTMDGKAIEALNMSFFDASGQRIGKRGRDVFRASGEVGRRALEDSYKFREALD